MDLTLGDPDIKKIHKRISADFSKQLAKTSPINFTPYHLFIEYKKGKDVLLVGNIQDQTLRKELYRASKGKGAFRKEQISVGICFMHESKLHFLQDQGSSGRKNEALKALKRIKKESPKIGDNPVWLKKPEFDELVKISNKDLSDAAQQSPISPDSVETDTYESYTAYIEDRLDVIAEDVDLSWYQNNFLPKFKAKRVTQDDIAEGETLRAEVFSFLLMLSSANMQSQQEHKDRREKYLAFIKEWDKTFAKAGKQAKKNELSKEERQEINQTLREMKELRGTTKDILSRIKLSDFV